MKATGFIKLFGFVLVGVLALVSCTDPSPDFSLSVAPISVVAGSSAETTVTIRRDDFRGAIAFSLSGLPSGVSEGWSETSSEDDRVTLTLTAAESTTPGDYELTVTGNGGSNMIKQVQLALSVTLAPGEANPGEPDPSDPDPSDPDPSEPEPGVTKADYNAYSSGLPGWSEFSPVLPDERRATGAASNISEVLGDVTYDCTVTPYTLTSTPQEIVTLEPDAGVFWAGALLQGRGYKDGIGSLRELPVRERTPLVLSIDILSGDNSRTVENPTAATVQQAIGELVEQATREGNRAGSSVFYEQETSHSLAQSALDLGLSVKFLGASVKSKLGYSQRADETTMTAYFVQKMFTVSIVQPQTPESVFSDAFTQEKLERQQALGNIGRDNIPTYVASVTYGRIMSFTFTSTASESEIRATLNAAYSGQSASLTAEQKRVLETAKVQLVTVGGEAANALAAIRSGNIKDYFDPDAALTSAKPISYVVRNLGDNSIAQVSETTNYNIRECTARAAEKKGERVRINIEKIQVITDCDRGINPDGDMIGKLWINDELVWNLPETEYGDGEEIRVDRSVTKDYFYDSPERIRVGGFLTDVDTGDDERVGLWDVYHDPLDPATKRSYVYNSNPKCEADLHYSIEKVEDLF